MDNLAHGLFGAALARTGLRRWSPLATPTLIIGANLPDLDAAATLWGSDAALSFRRGWTHGVLAMAALPLALAGLVWAFDKWVRRRRNPSLPPARFVPLLALSALAVLSHSLLDWLNTYGIRLLMPFDSSWFYGDALFIIDPWVWLTCAAPVAWVHSKSKKSIALWLTAGALTSGLVLLTDFVGWGVKVTWLVGLGALVAVRLWKGPLEDTRLVARAVVAGAVLYSAAMWAGSSLLEQRVASWVTSQGLDVVETHAGPLPGNPLARDVIVVRQAEYRFVTASGLFSTEFAFSHPPVARAAPPKVVQDALAQPHVRGLAHWLRFPTWKVEQTPTGHRVLIQDVRYSRHAGGLGTRWIDAP